MEQILLMESDNPFVRPGSDEGTVNDLPPEQRILAQLRAMTEQSRRARAELDELIRNKAGHPPRSHAHDRYDLINKKKPAQK
jgi:hypothetical protein